MRVATSIFYNTKLRQRNKQCWKFSCLTQTRTEPLLPSTFSSFSAFIYSTNWIFGIALNNFFSAPHLHYYRNNLLSFLSSFARIHPLTHNWEWISEVPLIIKHSPHCAQSTIRLLCKSLRKINITAEFVEDEREMSEEWLKKFSNRMRMAILPTCECESALKRTRI